MDHLEDATTVTLLVRLNLKRSDAISGKSELPKISKKGDE
jgi:hypothetical protein